MAEDAVSWRVVQPGVLLVSLHRAPANALGTPLLDGMHAALDTAATTPGIKVLVICSEIDGFFAAGADIKQLAAINAESFTEYGDSMRAVNDRLAGGSLLSIAAVDGLALGGGLELAMACTMRVSGPKARYGLPEVKIGLIPGAGGTQRLPRLVGRGRALDIMVTGRQVPAEEAYAMGLVDRLVAGDALAAALELACALCKASLPAQLAAVRSIDAAFDLPLTDGFRYEAAQEQSLFEEGEAAEGITAFIEKRAPRFA